MPSTVLYELCCTLLYCVVQYSTVLDWSVLYRSVFYYDLVYIIVLPLYCIVFVLYCTVHYYGEQHISALYNTLLWSTVNYCAEQ